MEQDVLTSIIEKIDYAFECKKIYDSLLGKDKMNIVFSTEELELIKELAKKEVKNYE